MFSQRWFIWECSSQKLHHRLRIHLQNQFHESHRLLDKSSPESQVLRCIILLIYLSLKSYRLWRYLQNQFYEPYRLLNENIFKITSLKMILFSWYISSWSHKDSKYIFKSIWWAISTLKIFKALLSLKTTHLLVIQTSLRFTNSRIS